MRVSIIAAVARNRVIGRAGGLPWHLPADLARFQRLTLGHHLILGRKTFESLAAPLRGRTLIVVTHRPDYRPAGALVARSLEQALGQAGADDEVFIAGGAQIYRLALARADRLYLTMIDAEPAGDTLFPEFQLADWRLIERADHPADSRHAHAFAFLTYDRNRPQE